MSQLVIDGAVVSVSLSINGLVDLGKSLELALEVKWEPVEGAKFCSDESKVAVPLGRWTATFEEPEVFHASLFCFS